MARRRSVPRSRRFARDSLSAYMRTLPLTFRAARPIVLDEARRPAEEPSLFRVDDRDDDTSGVRSIPSRSRLTPTITSTRRAAGRGMIWIRSKRVDLRVEVRDAVAVLQQVVGQVRAIFFVQRRDDVPLARGLRAQVSFIRSSIWFLVSRASTSRIDYAVGRRSALRCASVVCAEVHGLAYTNNDLARVVYETRRMSWRPVVDRARQPEAVLTSVWPCASGRPTTLRPICGTVLVHSSMNVTKLRPVKNSSFKNGACALTRAAVDDSRVISRARLAKPSSRSISMSNWVRVPRRWRPRYSFPILPRLAPSGGL